VQYPHRVSVAIIARAGSVCFFRCGVMVALVWRQSSLLVERVQFKSGLSKVSDSVEWC
jgi:hypothetical protein